MSFIDTVSHICFGIAIGLAFGVLIIIVALHLDD